MPGSPDCFLSAEKHLLHSQKPEPVRLLSAICLFPLFHPARPIMPFFPHRHLQTLCRQPLDGMLLSFAQIFLFQVPLSVPFRSSSGALFLIRPALFPPPVFQTFLFSLLFCFFPKNLSRKFFITALSYSVILCSDFCFHQFKMPIPDRTQRLLHAHTHIRY